MTAVQSGQRLYVFRHGATEWSVAGRHTGLTDLPLIASGRRKAEQLRPHLQDLPLAAVYTSPLQRARHTCELAGLGQRARTDPDLMEWRYGDYEGLTTEEVHRMRPGWEIFSDGCPNGEGPDDVAVRVDRVIARVRGMRGNVALFAHGHVLRVLAARWLGLPPGAGRSLLLDPATVNVLGDYYAVPAIAAWNAPLEAAALFHRGGG